MAQTQRYNGHLRKRAFPIKSFQIKQHEFSAPPLEPALYIVSTPIGNLGDMTLRGLEVLAACDFLACEDTRVTGKLLRHFVIDTKMISYHEHNAEKVGPDLLEKIKAGGSIGLVSDAGTPLVSDPGYRLVSEAKKQSIRVISIPGASAPVAALASSGLSNQSWTFCGFLPNKTNARRKALETFSNYDSTLIFFESPNRLLDCLTDMETVYGNRQACIARELTKLHEDVSTATLSELRTLYSDRRIKGEIVILVSPPEQNDVVDVNVVLAELLETMPVSKAAAEAALLTGMSKREIYQRALSLKNERTND